MYLANSNITGAEISYRFRSKQYSSELKITFREYCEFYAAATGKSYGLEGFVFRTDYDDEENLDSLFLNTDFMDFMISEKLLNEIRNKRREERKVSFYSVGEPYQILQALIMKKNISEQLLKKVIKFCLSFKLDAEDDNALCNFCRFSDKAKNSKLLDELFLNEETDLNSFASHLLSNEYVSEELAIKAIDSAIKPIFVPEVHKQQNSDISERKLIAIIKMLKRTSNNVPCESHDNFFKQRQFSITFIADYYECFIGPYTPIVILETVDKADKSILSKEQLLNICILYEKLYKMMKKHYEEKINAEDEASTRAYNQLRIEAFGISWQDR